MVPITFGGLRIGIDHGDGVVKFVGHVQHAVLAEYRQVGPDGMAEIQVANDGASG